MGSNSEQRALKLATILVALVVAGCFLILGSTPASAFAASNDAQQTNTTTTSEAGSVSEVSVAGIDVEVSTEGSAARAEGTDFALADFSRLEKGSSRPIDGVYHGYCYLMDSPEDTLCVVDLSAFVVVYIPESMVQANGIDLSDEATQRDLIALISALDSYGAEGNSVIKSTVPWCFTSQKTYTYGSLSFAFSQEYKSGYWYTSIIGTDGSDITSPDNPLLQNDPDIRLSHVDYASIQKTDEVAIAAAPSWFDELVSFFQTLDWSPLWVTLKTTGTALIFIFILGLLAAWWTLHLSPRIQSIVDAILTIPMVLPPTVCGFLLLLCLGRNTPVGAWFDQIGFPLVFSWQATVIAAVVVAFPLMYRSARGAFETIDTDMLDAARTLGWGEGRIFFRLMLPLAWSSIAAGTMLAFARALGEFGATLFLAGNYVGITRTIPIAIYFEWMGGNIEAALFWTIVVIIVSFVVIFAINLWSKRTTKYRRKEVDS